MNKTLTKTSYLNGLNCEKLLWLESFSPKLIKPPTAFEQNLMDDGHEVGRLVQDLFPGGKEVSKSITDRNERIIITNNLLKRGVKAIYEATFFVDNIEVRIDALIKVEAGYEIRELKSTKWKNNSSKKDKKFEKHISDVAIQYYVLDKLGIIITNSFVMAINGEYIRGNQLITHSLFKAINITEEVLDAQASIPLKIKIFNQILADDQHEPNKDIGSYCHVNNQKCGAKKYCWQEQRKIPSYSVFEIFTLGVKSLDLYQEGITNIKDIPDDYESTPLQKFYIDHWNNKSLEINHKELNTFISELKFPLFHLDFESFNPAIPKYKNSMPYQQIPFQYSIHIEHNDENCDHREFLGDPKADPREELICQLLSDIKGDSSVIVYSSFEEKRIKELAKDFPIYSDELLSILPRIKDFEEIFKKRYYYSYQLEKKWSIKKVMQLLVPKMESKYTDLKAAGKVSCGEEAILACKKLFVEDNPNEIEVIRKELFDYCELDTLATVESLRAIRAIHLSNKHKGN